MTSGKFRAFVSSAQKELEDERLIINNLIISDQFLASQISPVLYELQPASPERAIDGCLKTIHSCPIYLLIVGSEYGNKIKELGDISVTHAEYRHAKDAGASCLVFIKGDSRFKRDEATEAFLKEITDDGLKYKRFGNIVELQKEVRAALVGLLDEKYDILSTSDEDIIAEQTIEATSTFESQTLTSLSWDDLDHGIARRLFESTKESGEPLQADDLVKEAIVRGLIYRNFSDGGHYATAAGVLMLARNPSTAFPQVRIMADAYRSTVQDREPRDQEDIWGPLPEMIEKAMSFVDRNTRHPMRVMGLNRVRIDEYPKEALREALVNAVAHRQYEDRGRKIILEVFSDRVVISSPGLPPSPITLAKLRSGNYRPCSRNPLIAQCLSHFQKIEERGSGFMRMRELMFQHGLNNPAISIEDGYFQVTLRGPGENIDQIRVPESRLLVTPAIEATLNERQLAALKEVLTSGSVASGWLVKKFNVAYDTANRDLKGLAGHGILIREGKGRSVKYIMNPKRT